MQHGQTDLIAQYEMAPFSLNLLDHRRTLTEKLVSLIRCSLADESMQQMAAKIRHFYDLHHLLQDSECRIYLQSDDFKNDFNALLEHDRQSFSKPEGWQDRPLSESPLITDLHATWKQLQPTYLNGLPEIVYREIPTVDEVESSIQTLLTYL